MTPQEQRERKKNRALVGLAIGLMLGVWTAAQSYGSVPLDSWFMQVFGSCIIAPVIFALIGGGAKGFAALFSRST